MARNLAQTLKLLYCYEHVDKALRDDLDRHLSSLKHQKLITTWYDYEITPGKEWEREATTYLETAHIILLLISPHFMASDYCYTVEMKQAMKRHNEGKACVIPVILRPVIWEDAPFSKLQILPMSGVPITRWEDRDEALWEVAKGIQKVVKEMYLSLKTEKERRQEEQQQIEKALNNRMRDNIMLEAYENAIFLGCKDAIVYALKGHILNNLELFEEALAACEEAISLDSSNITANANKGYALNRLERYDEGLEACDKTIQLEPNYATAYNNKGYALMGLKRYNEALAAYEMATHLEPDEPDPYHNIGDVLISLKRYDEAEVAYTRAHELGFNLLSS